MPLNVFRGMKCSFKRVRLTCYFSISLKVKQKCYQKEKSQQLSTIKKSIITHFFSFFLFFFFQQSADCLGLCRNKEPAYTENEQSQRAKEIQCTAALKEMSSRPPIWTGLRRQVPQTSCLSWCQPPFLSDLVFITLDTKSDGLWEEYCFWRA